MADGEGTTLEVEKSGKTLSRKMWVCTRCFEDNEKLNTVCWNCHHENEIHLKHRQPLMEGCAEKKTPVDRTEKEIPVNRTEKKIPVNRPEKKISVDRTEKKIPVNRTEKKISVDRTEKKIPVNRTEKKIPVERTEKKIPVGRTEKKIPVAMIGPLTNYGVDKNEQRIVLIGKTGVGKSSTANTILGGSVFDAKASPTSVTEKCHFDRRVRFGKKNLLVDTPGLFETSSSKDMIENELKKCIGIAAPGPHAFILVMSLTNRFTEEERRVLKEIEDLFGDQMISYLIVLFTGRDQLDQGTSIRQHIKEYPREFRTLVQHARGGYITFNNKGSHAEKEYDVQKLLNGIDRMVKKNGGGHFTSIAFETAETVIQQRIAHELAAKKEEMRKEVEEEIRREVEDDRRAALDAEKTLLKRFRKEDFKQYKFLKRELDRDRLKKNRENRDFKESMRSLVIHEMKTDAEKKILDQIEKSEGRERAEVRQQLAGIGQEIKHRGHWRKRVQEGIPSEDEDSDIEDAGDPEEEDSLKDELQEDANNVTETLLTTLRDEERDKIQRETGALLRMKKKMKGFMSPFLNLFS